MANSRSALKRVRQTETRTVKNRALKSKMKTLRKSVAAAVESGDSQAAAAKLKSYESVVDRAAKTNLIHKNAAGRLKSRAGASLKKTVEG